MSYPHPAIEAATKLVQSCMRVNADADIGEVARLVRIEINPDELRTLWMSARDDEATLIAFQAYHCGTEGPLTLAGIATYEVLHLPEPGWRVIGPSNRGGFRAQAYGQPDDAERLEYDGVANATRGWVGEAMLEIGKRFDLCKATPSEVVAAMSHGILASAVDHFLRYNAALGLPMTQIRTEIFAAGATYWRQAVVAHMEAKRKRDRQLARDAAGEGADFVDPRVAEAGSALHGPDDLKLP